MTTEHNLFSVISTILGIAVSAMIPLTIFGYPIYLFFIKPRLSKSQWFNKLRSNFSSLSTTGSSKSSPSTTTSTSASTSNKKNLLIDQSGTVPVEDLAYIAKVLSPDSTHMDVLFAVITTPENIEWSEQDLDRATKEYNDRVEKDKKNNDPKNTNKKKQNDGKGDFDHLFEEDGWADDEDEDHQKDEAVLKFKQAEEERQAELERLKQATGQAVSLLEGLDKGVLGQKWVEKTLTSAKVWPPSDLRFLKGKTFVYNGKQVQALDHPGIRRLLCMTIGRLNSLFLNGHPELLEAGSKKLIDQTYFRSSMEFRQRASMVLEASLRIGMIVRNTKLVQTIIETICLFKIGTLADMKGKNWFNNHMMKTYNILPRIIVKSNTVVTPGHTDIVCKDLSELRLDIERQHAENFLRQKIEMFQKQGVPPQVGLSTYREGWWFLLHMEHVNVDATSSTNEEVVEEPPFDIESALKQIPLDTETIQKFTKSIEKSKNSQRLITAWPLMIQNVAQKSGVVKIQFQTPALPGTYRYIVSIKSSDFLDADQEVSVDVKVVSSTKANRKPRVATTIAKTITTTEETKSTTEETK